MSNEIAFARRSAGSKPGPRGPHLNLFSGGLPKQKTETVAIKAADRVAAFAAQRELREDAVKVLGLVVEHYESTGRPYEADTFEISRNTGIGFDQVHVIKSQLLSASVLRVRSANVWGTDGLVPGDAWNERR